MAANFRKAAMLLMDLDAQTAGELLKGASPQAVTEIAAELAYLRASNAHRPTGQYAREFATQLSSGSRPSAGGDFLRTVLDKALGSSQSRELLDKMDELVESRDPFMQLRSAPPAELALGLRGETPQAMAVMLAELPPKQSSQLLALLEEKMRLPAVRALTSGTPPSRQARAKVAAIVRQRIAAARAAAQQSDSPVPIAAAATEEKKDDPKLRQVALLLRNLDTSLRDAMVKSLAQADPDLGRKVQDLMVVWDDLVLVADRSLQLALRSVDSKKLALAMMGADGALLSRIRANMSERAVAMLDEETSLLTKPKPEEIRAARESILKVMRDANARGELQFAEET